DEVRGNFRLSVAEPSRTAALAPRKERDVRPWCPFVIAEIEVIGVFVVVIDGLFDEPQTERFDVELGDVLGVARDGGHMMQSRYGRRHYVRSNAAELFIPPLTPEAAGDTVVTWRNSSWLQLTQVME